MTTPTHTFDTIERTSEDGRRSGKRGASFLVALLGLFAINSSGLHAGQAAARPELEIGRSSAYDYDAPEPGSYSLPVLKPAADGQVLDTSGKPSSLRALLEGRISVVSFIYTRCASPTACPHATGVLRTIHQISQEDRTIADNAQLITLSFDPAHDTPERMASYSKWVVSENPGADWLFLTTPSEQHLAPILKDYGQAIDRKQNPYDPLGPLFHPVRVYLVDRKGRIRNIYSFGMLDPRLILTDIRTLLLEEQGGAVRN
jgi:protein SCO1